MSLGTENWTATTRERIRHVQDQLLSAASWASDGHADETATELLLRPYRELLDAIYERDLPLAKLVDDSDLLLHVHGPAASGPAPRVSVLTRILTQTRDQVTRLAKQLGGVTTMRVPAALDMRLVGVAGGSLFVGFSAAEATQEGDLTRQAVESIADVSALIAGDATAAVLAKSMADPAARDMAVAAVRQLSPSGLIGIKQIELLGRRVRHATSLTTETRRHARVLMSQPATAISERRTFVGTVREVDLDASRFEIRNVDGHPEDIRCAHELEEEVVKRLVDKRVRVAGAPEFGVTGVVRLLWVDEVEALE
jgi:hypothetical protein